MHAFSKATSLDSAVPLGTAAGWLGVSRDVVRYGLKSGAIPDLTLATLLDLVSRPILDSLEVDGHPVPLLRAAPAAKAADPSRAYFGVDATDTDAKSKLDGVAGFWGPQGRNLVCNAGAFIVGSGTIVQMWVDVDGFEDTSGWSDAKFAAHGLDPDHPQDRNRVRFNATLVASIDHGSVTEDNPRGVVVHAPSSPNLSEAKAVLASRVITGGGGNFITLGL